MGFGKKAALAAAGLFSGVGGAVAYKLDQVIPTDNCEETLYVDVQEVQAELSLHAPHMPWSHSGNFDSLDHGSIRRGYQVSILSMALTARISLGGSFDVKTQGVQASLRCLPFHEVSGLPQLGGHLPH